MAAASQPPAPSVAEAFEEGVVKATTKEEQAHPAPARRDHDLKYMLVEEANEDSAAITVDEEAAKKAGPKPVSVQQSASFKEEMNVAADLMTHTTRRACDNTEMEQASSTHHGKPTTTLHRLLPPSPDLRQGIWIVDSGNADAWRANPAVSANRRVHCMIVSFVAAIAGFTVLIVSTNYLDLREAQPTTMSLLFLVTALVTLLVFRQMRGIDHLFQLDRIPHRAEESFRLAWRSLVLVQCAVFCYIILSVPFPPLSTPTSSSFTSIVTAASAVAAAAAAAVASALPLLFLLFPLLLVLLLWFVVRRPERLHEEQRPSLIKTNRPRFTWRSLFQALSVVLSCSMLLTNPTGTDIAAGAIVVVLTIISFWFALSSNPPLASSPTEKQEAAPEYLLVDKV